MFNQDYDRTLWLMLVSDKEGRQRLCEFIRDIPYEAYEQINQIINLYRKNGEVGTVNISKMTNSGLGKLCFYAHIFEDGELSLLVRKYQTMDKITNVSEYSLSLMPVDMMYLQNMPFISSDRYIGEVNDNIRNVVVDSYDQNSFCEISYEKEFDLIRTPVGYFIKVNNDTFVEPKNMFRDKQDNVKYSKRFRTSSIPDRIYVHQFDNEKRVNRLVRGKKRNRKRSK